jgi:hypothetical protein
LKELVAFALDLMCAAGAGALAGYGFYKAIAIDGGLVVFLSVLLAVAVAQVMALGIRYIAEYEQKVRNLRK